VRVTAQAAPARLLQALLKRKERRSLHFLISLLGGNDNGMVADTVNAGVDWFAVCGNCHCCMPCVLQMFPCVSCLVPGSQFDGLPVCQKQRNVDIHAGDDLIMPAGQLLQCSVLSCRGWWVLIKTCF